MGIFLVADICAGRYYAQQYNCIEQIASSLIRSRKYLPIILPMDKAKTGFASVVSWWAPVLDAKMPPKQ